MYIWVSTNRGQYIGVLYTLNYILPPLFCQYFFCSFYPFFLLLSKLIIQTSVQLRSMPLTVINKKRSGKNFFFLYTRKYIKTYTKIHIGFPFISLKNFLTIKLTNQLLTWLIFCVILSVCKPLVLI